MRQLQDTHVERRSPWLPAAVFEVWPKMNEANQGPSIHPWQSGVAVRALGSLPSVFSKSTRTVRTQITPRSHSISSATVRLAAVRPTGVSFACTKSGRLANSRPSSLTFTVSYIFIMHRWICTAEQDSPRLCRNSAA